MSDITAPSCPRCGCTELADAAGVKIYYCASCGLKFPFDNAVPMVIADVECHQQSGTMDDEVRRTQMRARKSQDEYVAAVGHLDDDYLSRLSAAIVRERERRGLS